MKSLREHWPLVMILAAGGVGWTIGVHRSASTTVSFISVGQGDCTVFSSQGYTILIDDGPASPYDNAAERIILPWLAKNGFQRVDAIFLSHPDEDHVGGTPAILAKYPGASVIVSDQFETDPEMQKRLAEWKMNPGAIRWIPHFCNLTVGDANVVIDCPERPAGEDANNGSMFMRISEGSGSIVFSGDAPDTVERRMETDEDWKSEIDHVGHHGSHTASDPSWLRAVSPKYAVISVGRNNRYGHPSQQTLDRLESEHIQVLRTDRDGTITFRFNGDKFVPDSNMFRS